MTDLSGLGIPALEWGEVFHMGIRVADLAAAQQELTDALGVSWTKPATIPMKAWAPGVGYGGLRVDGQQPVYKITAGAHWGHKFFPPPAAPTPPAK